MGRFVGTGGATILTRTERHAIEQRLREAGKRRKAERDAMRIPGWKEREVGAKSAKKPVEVR